MNKAELRQKYGYAEDDFILLYIAEFIPRKNHEFLLRVIPELHRRIPELKIIMPGKGILLKEMKKLAVDLEIDDIVKFPGYRKDISSFCQISDVYVTVSLQEGLPISVIEAMASGLPLVVSSIRGQVDVVHNGRNGFLFSLENPNELAQCVIKLYKDSSLREKVSSNNLTDCKKYSVETALKKMVSVYKEMI